MKKTPAALSDEEKKVAKALLLQGQRSQDVHALINYERAVTVNFGRISGVKKDALVEPASLEEVALYRRKKRSFDPVTGLSVYNHERLIRAREAMMMAVAVFNGISYKFKTEIFVVLSNIAWTYMLHEYYDRQGVKPLNKDGTTFSLSFMISRADCLLSKGIKNNLAAIKQIRDDVEHKMLGRSDINFLPLFQANCLNFDKTIVEWFGDRVTLQGEISVALQFAKLNLEHLAQLEAYDVPSHISALDALLSKNLTEEELNDIEYQFKVVYTLNSASKGKAHIQFLHPDSEEGKSVQHILQKFKVADELYPYKPKDVVRIVKLAIKTAYTMSDHTNAWRNHKVRPSVGAPEKTNREFCIYHAAHKDYTYNEKWAELLISEIQQIVK